MSACNMYLAKDFVGFDIYYEFPSYLLSHVELQMEDSTKKDTRLETKETRLSCFY